MRAFGLLILLLAVLGFGVLPNSASAEPCSFHLHPAAAIEHRADIAAAVIAPTAAYEAILGGGLDPATTTPHPVSDHAVPKGQFCCHAAAAVTPALGPVVEPLYGNASKIFLHSELPPWAAPTSDIYRPPACA